MKNNIIWINIPMKKLNTIYLYFVKFTISIAKNNPSYLLGLYYILSARTILLNKRNINN